MKPRWPDNTLLGGSYQYTVCTTPDQFKRELDRMGWPLDDRPFWLKNETSHACCHTFHDKGVALVCIRPALERDPIQVAGLLVHEAVHIWQWECKMIGEDEPSIELEAFAIQRISQGLMSEYRRQVYG